MSLNTAHINGGVLIHGGECILLFSDKVTIEWGSNENPAFKGTKKGRIYLTTHRMIFNSESSNDKMLSFSFPFITLSEVGVEQPVFGANYIQGKVVSQPNGNWQGTNTFKIHFKHGGAIEFSQAMLRAASMARANGAPAAPPPYVPPAGQWYPAPPPAYAPPPTGHYGWVPQNVFPNHPPQNTVFMSDAPPPYPGINLPPGAHGVNSSPGAFAKAAEAAQAQSAYYDPNQPQMAYVPPPAYYENPPSYDQATNKKQN